MAMTAVKSQPRSGPPRRRPITQANGSAITANRPDSARTATSPVPNTDIQAWRST